MNNYNVIVVGSGHSGIEAASASSRMGCKTLLITDNIDSIGQMSCNPSIGGIGKSHLVKEIDSLDGLMGIAIDKSGIQFKKLNTNKGPAVQSTRAQADRYIYKKEILKLLIKNENLDIIQQKVEKLIIKNNKIIGLETNLKIIFYSNSIVLTLGTFLNGVIYIGNDIKINGGRMCDSSSNFLSNQLKEVFPLSVNRLKTGTPPRIDKRTINFSSLEKQKNDEHEPRFSYIYQKNKFKRISCYITYTNTITHEIINENLHKSPVYSNIIKSIGPRYCPSIEDKVYKFSNKNNHQIFLEPESLYSYEIYPNGISTSLPFEIQIKIIKSINGLEKSIITRPGYAVEYDFLDPKNLNFTLESKIISGLFMAGQINGTTGYEEAASQGIIAGINAAMNYLNKEKWYPRKEYSYIGVMINDLCNKGVNEPYRMFTSRSENRLSIREDNADLRLTEIGYNLNVVKNNRWKKFLNKKNKLFYEKNRLKETFIKNNSLELNKINKEHNLKINKNISIYELLKNNKIDYKYIINNKIFFPLYKNEEIYKNIEIDSKYENYIIKQNKQNKIKKEFNNIKINENINYEKISGLSNEVKYLLKKYKPKNLEEASNISGMTISSIFILSIWIKKNKI